MANARGKRKETKPVDEAMGNIENTVDETIKNTNDTTPSNKTGVVDCQNLNVRKAPTMGSTILRIIPKDTEVEILADANETWYKVRIGDIGTGFCMKEFIKVEK